MSAEDPPEAEPETSEWAPPRGAPEVLPDPPVEERLLTPAQPPEARPAPPVAPPDATDEAGVIRAAGGVVWTRWEDGRLRVALVHRPKYGDWSLPKGKADPGEADAACALREVREETGLACSLGEELGSISYRDRRGRPKTVRYWAMQPMGGTFAPHPEIDEVRWVAVEEVGGILSYEDDVEVVAALAAREGGAEEEGPPAQGQA